MDALDDVDAVEHGTRGAVPLCHHRHVAVPERVDGLLQLEPPRTSLPKALSRKIWWQPSGRRAAICRSRFWGVETRA
jgi:hypothetical protein